MAIKVYLDVALAALTEIFLTNTTSGKQIMMLLQNTSTWRKAHAMKMEEAIQKLKIIILKLVL